MVASAVSPAVSTRSPYEGTEMELGNVSYQSVEKGVRSPLQHEESYLLRRVDGTITQNSSSVGSWVLTGQAP